MKTLFIFILFIVISCKSIPEKPPSIEDYPILRECDSIGKIAKMDFKNGIREYDILGTVTLTDFEMFYWEYMEKNYNIIIKASDAPTFEEECYAESMNNEIEK